MLNYRDGAPGSRFAADSMAAYLAEQQAGPDMAAYYGSETAMVRPDVDPALAAALGIALDRPITKEELSNLLSGRRADGAEIEGKQNQRASLKKGKITYTDWTLSAPKSFSVALELAETTAEREALERCHVTAVDKAMRYYESQVGEVRRGKAGRKGVEAGSIAWIKFEDYVARPTVMIADGRDTIRQNLAGAGDMQRHTHVITPNIVRTADGHLGAMNLKRRFGRVLEFGAIYQGFLATELRKLGVDAGYDKRTDMSHLADVPLVAVKEFSKRTVDGEATAKAWAAQNGADWNTLDAKRKIALVHASTRQRRHAKGDGHADRAGWRAQAEAIGYHHRSMLRPGEERGLGPRADRQRVAYETGLPVLEKELARRARFEGQALRTVAAKGFIAAGLEDPAHDIIDLVRAFNTEGVQQQGETTALLWAKAENEQYGHYSTVLHVKHEEEAISLLRVAAVDASSALARPAIDRALVETRQRTGVTLLPEQMDMVRAIIGGGRFTAVIGAAGVGKTELLKPAVAAWHSAGRDTVGISLQNITAADMKEAGFHRVHSVHGFLVGHEKGVLPKLGPNTVVVMDEMAKVGTWMSLQLARLQAAHGFQMVWLGDDKQCAAIDAGNAVRLCEHVLGEGKVPELTRTIRQERERDRETALMFRQGRALEALERKLEDGTLLIVPGGPSDAVRAAVDLWEERIAANAGDPKYTIGISVPTNADTRAVAEVVRSRLRSRGQLGKHDAVVVDAVDRQGTEYDLPLAVGDRVRLFNRVNGHFAGSRWGSSRVGDNGSVVSIESINRGGLVVRTANGKVASVDWDEFRKEQTGERLRLAHGYALTNHAEQGKTITEKITMLPQGSQAINGLETYTAESRHRRTSWIVTSQGKEQEEIEKRRPIGDARNDITARAKVERFIVENMARNFSRQEQKVLAVDFLRTAARIREGTVNAMQAVWHRAAGSDREKSAPVSALQMPAAVVARQERDSLRELAEFFSPRETELPGVVRKLHGLDAKETTLPPMPVEVLAQQVVDDEIDYGAAEHVLLRELQTARRRAEDVVKHGPPERRASARTAITAIGKATEKRRADWQRALDAAYGVAEREANREERER